ncbi:MAG: radical SAM protein [Planctomycetota bacterium]|nr:radical SAM protein [Planctomycetota bacterium]
MTDILLIHPPYSWPNKSQPLGLAYIGAVLEQEGFGVEIIDMSPLEMSVADLGNILVEKAPKIVGISFMTPQYNSTVAILKLVKEVDERIKTIVGGAHASALPEAMLEIEQLDYVVIGEGEITTKELVSVILGKSDRKAEEIKGIGFVRNNKCIFTEVRPLMTDLDTVPFPAWHLLPMDRYSVESLGGERGESVYPLLSSRGCPNRCIFCSSHVVFKRQFRERSAANIVAEIEFLAKRYNARQFDFVDDTVTVNKKRMVELCEHLVSHHKNIRWLCNSRVNTVTPDLLKTMYKAGCRKVDFGVESGNPDILKNIKKGITLEQAVDAHRWARKAGLITSSFFMVGNLGEGPEHIRKTADFIDELETDYVSATITTPFPGTELYSIADSQGWIYERDWSKYDTTAFISKDYKPVASNGTMSREQLLEEYFFLNSRLLKRKFRQKYGKYYLLNYRLYYREVFSRIRRLGIVSTLKLVLRLLKR